MKRRSGHTFIGLALAGALAAGLIAMPFPARGQDDPPGDGVAAAPVAAGAQDDLPEPFEDSGPEVVPEAPELAAEREATARLLVRLGEIPSPTGDEAPLREVVRAELLAGGSVRSAVVDAHGNLRVDTGTPDDPAGGRDALLFLLPLDDPAYAVSGIDDDGWLRLVPVARPSLPATFHRQMAGAEVWVLAAGGALPAVVALPSIHLQGGRAGFPPPASPDHLYVDTGADTPAGNGVALLDRVVARGDPQVLAGRRVAGFGIGQRAAMAAAIRATRRSEGVAPLVLLAQSRFLGRGARAVQPLLEAWGAAGGGLVVLQPAETGGVLEVAPLRPSAGEAQEEAALVQARAVAERLGSGPVQPPVRVVDFASREPGVPAVTAPVTMVRFPVERRDGLAETIDLDVVLALSHALEHSGGGGGRSRSRSGPRPDEVRWRQPARLFPADQRKAFVHLPALIQAPGVSGNETAVRDAVCRLLPRRFDEHASVDESGNLVIDLGEGSPHLLFVAHLDETGFRVTAIEDDGQLALERRGGFYDSALVGRPVHVHTPNGIVPGVVVQVPPDELDEEDESMPEAAGTSGGAPASSPASRAGGGPGARGTGPPPGAREDGVVLVERLPIETLRVDVGTRSAAATGALGVAVGDSITVPKRFRRLGEHRGYARGVDDRAGSAVLIAALHRLARASAGSRDAILPDDYLDAGGNPAGGRLTFAWVTREEIGLEGSRELAERLAPDAVFAVDTFVSADSPLENHRFGLAPLGGGAVLRALDSSNLAPLAAVRATLAGAREAGIAVQAGAGRGGNDGSVFVRHDAPDLPLSWPGRYSHSAIEVIDERDHEALVDLVLWLILNPGAVLPGEAR